MEAGTCLCDCRQCALIRFELILRFNLAARESPETTGFTELDIALEE